MAHKKLEDRLAMLEQGVEALQKRLDELSSDELHWWRDNAGRFANDPVYDEIMRLGKKYRDSLHPDREKKSVKKKRKHARA